MSEYQPYTEASEHNLFFLMEDKQNLCGLVSYTAQVLYLKLDLLFTLKKTDTIWYRYNNSKQNIIACLYRLSFFSVYNLMVRDYILKH